MSKKLRIKKEEQKLANKESKKNSDKKLCIGIYYRVGTSRQLKGDA